MPASRRSTAVKASDSKSANNLPGGVEVVPETTTSASIKGTSSSSKAVAIATAKQANGAEVRRPKLPPAAQFPLAAALSFAMASLGYSLLGEMTKGELAAVSRSQDTWGEVAILAGWRL